MTPEELLALYKHLGLRLLFWDRFGKDPKDWKGPRDKGWNDPQRIYPIDQYDPLRHNVGTFTGHEIVPGQFLVDGDLDWAAGIVLARRLLPPTQFGFRREGKKLSHVLWTTPERIEIITYNDLTDDGKDDGQGQTFFELRGGNSSRMTMIAPSLHSPGVYIELVQQPTYVIASIPNDVLLRCGLDYGIGCLLLRRLPGGLHHDGRLALAGFLLKTGWEAARVLNLMEAVCDAQVAAGVSEMTPRDSADCTLVVGTTEQRLKDKEKRVAGGPKFAEFCGARGKDIVRRIRHWMGKTSEERLILSPQEPMRSAQIFVETKYTIDSSVALHNQNAVFYRYAPPAYHECEEPTMRAEVWKFLDGAATWSGGKEPTLGPFQPNSAKVSNSIDALKAVTNLSMDRMAPCWLESDPGIPPLDIVAFKNGLLHVPTRKLIPCTPDFFTVNGLNYDYEPNAPPPENWLKFLLDLWDEDPDTIATLQEVCGYLLCPDTRFQKIFMTIGPKRSGKSLIGRIIAKLVGEPNICAPSLSSFGRDFGKQPLVGKSLALIADARISGRTDTAAIAETLLAISGEDPQTVDRKYLPAWSGKLNTRFFIITNELPRIGDMSGALASRFIILLLTRSFFGREDLGLFDRIEPELPGILNWALEGRDRLYGRKYFKQPPSSEEMLQELSDLSSPTQAFLRGAVTGPDRDSSITTDDLFKLWRTWCTDNGIQHAGTAQNFGKSVRAAIPYVTMKQRGSRGEQKKVWVGIKLTEEWAMRLNDEGGAPNHGNQPPFPQEDM